MASRLQLVSELANRTAHAVTNSVDGWKRYLNTAAQIYKYPFDDQLLIYAQRPDATACASMELWNETMRRWVKPGSKGIALIRNDRRGRPSLEYVFDVADTRPVKGAKTPYLWEMREDHHAAVVEALERKYGPVENGDIGAQLMELAARAVNEVYRDRLSDLAYDVQNSLLEELDDLNLEVRFRDVLTASVQYTLLTRCGLDPADYMEDSDLLGITEFSTPAVLHHLGNAASAVSMTSKSPARSIEDVDATALSYAEVKMIATGDPRIREKMDLDIQVAKLKLLKSNHMAQKYEMEDMIIKHYPQKMAEAQLFIEALSTDLPILEAHPVKEDAFSMTILGKTYTERKDAGAALVKACKTMTDPKKPLDLGEYRGFPMQLHFDGAKFKVTMKQHLTYTAELSDDIVGNIFRINNALEKIPKNLEGQKQGLENLQKELATAKEEVDRPFPQEAELETKSARLSQLNIELDSDNRGGAVSQDKNNTPAPDNPDAPTPVEDKPSIKAAIRAYNPPTPVSPGMEKSHQRGVAI